MGHIICYLKPGACTLGLRTVQAGFWDQPAALGWPQNLLQQKTGETERFVRYDTDLSADSALTVSPNRDQAE